MGIVSISVNLRDVTFYLSTVVCLALAGSCAGPSRKPPSTVPQRPGVGWKPPTFDYRGDTQRFPAAIQVELEAGQHKMEKVEYEVLGEREVGTLIRMEGCHATTSPGDPVLPVRIYEVAVPPNIDWDSLELTVDPGRTVTLRGEWDLVPAPPLRARVGDEELIDWGYGKDIVAGRNMKVYGQDQFFPREPVRIVSQTQLRKWRFVRLEFSPVQYNPARKSLRVIQSAQVRLDFTRIGREVFRSDPVLDDTLMDEEAEKRFINYKEAVQWYRYVPAPRPGPVPEDPDYVIITTNTIRDSGKLANFVTHKTAQGHSVQIVTEDDYGALTGQPPYGTAEKIRQWLMNNYVALGIHYVLLIGDPDPDDPADDADSVGDVPMKMMWPHRQYSSYRESPTDYFYADLTGNWDLDGDGFFGESVSSTNPTTPDPTVDPDTFSVRWTGRIQADGDGTHWFRTVSDDGIRVKIDGATIIENWTDHYPTTDSGHIDLTTGEHDIEVEYYDNTGDGTAQFLWRPPGEIYYGHVPSSKLLHLVGGSYVSGGLDAEYFDNEDFTASVLTRVDPQINFYCWGTGDKGPGGVDFDPEVFVGRIPVYSDDYPALDGLDGILQNIIDYETGAPPAWRKSFLTAAVDMKPGKSDYELGEALRKDFADPLGFTTYRVYESDFGLVPAPECPSINAKDPDPTAPCNMLREWANGGGYGVVTWSTHGGPTSASHLIASADNVHLDETTPAFTFQGSCTNGNPEVANNLGYALLQRGAIGTVSASRVSWYAIFNPLWDPNPQSGTNENLTYHYACRIMQDRSAGHALYLTKANVSPTSSWMNKMDYNVYGDPSTALFRTIGGVVLLFDTSGSMSWSHKGVVGVPPAEQRLSLAKEAAKPFMVLLNAHSNMRTDFGISVFPPHPWSPSVGCNGQVVTPMTQVNDANTNTAVNSTIPNLVAQGNTPLLAGMQTAAGAFGAEEPRAIVLLSDGYHNCPSLVDAEDPAVTNLINDLKANQIHVYTIGFGRPTDADHKLLSRLATDTTGEFYDVTTATFDPTSWSPATDLQGTYKAILVDTLGLETAIDPMGVIAVGQHVARKVKLNELDRRVSFFLSWETPRADRLDLRLKSADGIDVPLTGTTPGVSFHQGNSYKIVTLGPAFLRQPGKIGPADWLLEIHAVGLDQGEQEHYQYSVILDSQLKMEVALDRKTYRVGDMVVLTAKLTAGQRPITGLRDVSVSITGPEEGRGNWFAKHKVTAAELREIAERRGDEILSILSRKALFLTDIRKLKFPGRTAPVVLRLYDDATHGDAAANDGVYTNQFADTSKEGTFCFHFRATGPIRGGAFERDRMIQKYLTPRPFSGGILVRVIPVLPPVGELRRFRVVVTPRDPFGNHIGPGYAKALQMRAAKGRLLGAVKDNLDGSYTQVFELPARVDLTSVQISGNAKGARFSFNLADQLKQTPEP